MKGWRHELPRKIVQPKLLYPSMPDDLHPSIATTTDDDDGRADGDDGRTDDDNDDGQTDDDEGRAFGFAEGSKSNVAMRAWLPQTSLSLW